MNNNPQISIVIPVKNGGPWLHDCLTAICSQTLFHRAEIIIIDSGSTDDSLSIIKKYPVRLYAIPAAEYDHGLTRNFGVRHCKGDYVVMTVQDAKATDNLWLQKLMDGFSAAENVAGVCGQQVVPHHRDKNPVDWFRPDAAPVTDVFTFTQDEYNALSSEQKKNACGWDNVTAMYKKAVLEKLPFQKIPYGEDAVWADEVLENGYTLVYNTAARVYHYHHEDPEFMFRRALTVMYFRYRHFGYLYQKHTQSPRAFLSELKTILTTKEIGIKEKWYWVTYNRWRRKALKKANTVFYEALGTSENELDNVHENLCGKPPVPAKARVEQKPQPV